MKSKKAYAHHEFFSQFVNDNVKNKVLAEFKIEELAASTCEHLNDLSLGRWDRIGLTCDIVAKIKSVKDASLSLSTAVCINKCAARMLVIEYKLNKGAIR